MSKAILDMATTLGQALADSPQRQALHAAWQTLHDKLVASDIFKRYTAAEMEFSDLMRQVHAAIRKQVSDATDKT